MPTFAFVNGLALGGGLEIALHCDFRTVSASAAGIGLPECFLGMFPGWGGAYLLPNLIGADRAVQVVIENALNQNRMLSGVQAAQLGIADALFEGADFLERSLDWAGRVWPAPSPSSGPSRTGARPGTRPSPAVGRSPTPRSAAPHRGRTGRSS